MALKSKMQAVLETAPRAHHIFRAMMTNMPSGQRTRQRAAKKRFRVEDITTNCATLRAKMATHTRPASQPRPDDQKWHLNETFAAFGVGCNENVLLFKWCFHICPSDPKMTLTHAPYGYRIVSRKPKKDNFSWWFINSRQYKCEGDLEIITMKAEDAPYVSAASDEKVKCKMDGYWYLGDDKRNPVINMACGEDCSGCEMDFGTPSLGLQNAIFSDYNGCVVPEACPSGPFYYALPGSQPTLSTSHTPKCTNQEWTLDGVGNIEKFFCGATSCMPLGILDSFCPHGSLCPQQENDRHMLRRVNSRKNKYECVNGGQLYVGNEANSKQPTSASCISCIPGKPARANCVLMAQMFLTLIMCAHISVAPSAIHEQAAVRICHPLN